MFKHIWADLCNQLLSDSGKIGQLDIVYKQYLLNRAKTMLNQFYP